MGALGRPIVSAGWLAEHLGDEDLRVADVRWVLGRPGAGRVAFEAARIPGAVFVDLDGDLAEHGDPKRGRHPLPSPQRFAARLAELGIGAGTRVVAYDDAAGTHAARLWWMLRWIGVEAAILDGGLAAWRAGNHLLDETPARPPTAAARPVEAPSPALRGVVDLAEMKRIVFARFAAPAITGRSPILLDARPGERFRGEVEPLDPRPGRIPTSRSAPTAGNLDGTGRFLPPEALRARFAELGVVRGDEVVCSCGSGVTACHNLLALELAGLGGARLYAGSYSEWVNQPELPIQTGP